jgi:hypothetical protein
MREKERGHSFIISLTLFWPRKRKQEKKEEKKNEK